jgi:imidazolonepropionase-like amidohydrolase
MLNLRTIAYAAIGSLSILGSRAADTPPAKTSVYLGATLIDGRDGPVYSNMAVIIQGDRITAIRPADGFRSENGQEIVDVRGKFIIPGLVNSHVHVATIADPRIARAYLRRELYSGVTMVRDMAGDVRLLAELKREAEFGDIPSPDIFYVALMAGPLFFIDPRTHDAARGRIAGQVPWMQAISAQTNLSIAVAEAKGTGATAVKLYADLPASLVKAITLEAHRQHMLVWSHAAVFPARPSDVVDAGVDVISHSCLLGYEVSTMPLTYHEHAPVDAAKAMQSKRKMDALFADIKRRGIILDATMYAFDTDPTPRCPAGIEDYLTRQAYRAGVAISAGTDDDPAWKDPDSALDTELSLLVGKAEMTPADAIRSATLIGADAAGQEKEAGSIEVGKLANLVVLDKNPLENIDNVRSVAVVVKHGIRYPRSDYKPVSPEEMQ